MSTEFFTQVDLDTAKQSAREHDAQVREDTEGVALIDLKCLANDLIRFMPEGIGGAKREGYIEAVKDLLIQVPGSTLRQSTADGSLEHSPTEVSVPLSVVDRALEQRTERGRGA